MCYSVCAGGAPSIPDAHSIETPLWSLYTEKLLMYNIPTNYGVCYSFLSGSRAYSLLPFLVLVVGAPANGYFISRSYS